VLLIAPVVVTCLLSSEVLGLFGADYAHHRALLVLLLLSTLPDAAINLAVAILRVKRRQAAAAAVTVTAAAMTLGGAWLLMPRLGITGAGWAALASLVIVATALPAIGHRRSVMSARTTGDSPACVAGEPPVVIAPPADVSLLSPVVAFAPPADESPPENTDRSGRS
jgi:Na+-driven multidrug efflux pump